MEITVKKEDLSQHDTGGGYKDININISVDNTLSPRLQRQTVIYELLGALLDPFETNATFISELTEKLGEVLDEIDENALQRIEILEKANAHLEELLDYYCPDR